MALQCQSRVGVGLQPFERVAAIGKIGLVVADEPKVSPS